MRYCYNYLVLALVLARATLSGPRYTVLLGFHNLVLQPSDVESWFPAIIRVHLLLLRLLLPTAGSFSAACAAPALLTSAP